MRSILLNGLCFLCLCGINKAVAQDVKTTRKIGGVNLVSPFEKDNKDYVSSTQRLGANWIAIIPYAFMESGNPEIEYNCPKNWWGDTPEGIKTTVNFSRSNKMKLLLKPHFWVDGKNWAGDISFNERDWQKWEKNYEAFILRMAEMAAQHKIEMLCIGTELKSAVKERPQYWTSLIPKIKAVYKGKLIYAANWDNYQNVHFWDQLDYMGIDAYFPLSSTKTPSVGELLFAWEQPKLKLKKWSDSLNLKIVFTEMGYRSIDGTAWKQWEIESTADDQNVNLKAQENGYNAIFKCFWDQEWFAGGFIWKWKHPDSKAGGKNKSDYSPQNKPVEKLIQKWFAK